MRSLVLLAVLVSGCSSSSGDLRPFVAAAGTYSLMAAAAGPTPAPLPATGCSAGCKCSGTGEERSGDGLAIVACRCPEGCKCKQRKQAAKCPTGACSVRK